MEVESVELIACSKCKEELPVSDFYKSNTIARGHAAACRPCSQEAIRLGRTQREKLDEDAIDWWRMTTYLKSSRVPIRNCNKLELIAEWNQLTTWYIPRMSQRRNPLKSYALNFDFAE